MKEEINEHGCKRVLYDEIKATTEDIAFFESRQMALLNISTALRSFDFDNHKLLDAYAKTKKDLLDFILEKQEKYNTPELDFDGKNYYVQIEHGPGCPSRK